MIKIRLTILIILFYISDNAIGQSGKITTRMHEIHAAETIKFLSHPSQNDHKIFTGNSSQYFIVPSLPVNHLTDGEIIAVPYDSQGKIVGAYIVEGQLPAGTTLHRNGLVTVTQSSSLKAGSYQFAVETMNADHNVSKCQLDLHLEEQVIAADHDAVFSLNRKKNIHEYVNNEALASALDHDGKIVDAVHIKGNLPDGTALRNDGNIVVEENEVMQAGTYNIWIATADEKRGISMFIITLMLQEKQMHVAD